MLRITTTPKPKPKRIRVPLRKADFLFWLTKHEEAVDVGCVGLASLNPIARFVKETYQVECCVILGARSQFLVVHPAGAVPGVKEQVVEDLCCSPRWDDWPILFLKELGSRFGISMEVRAEQVDAVFCAEVMEDLFGEEA